MKQLGKFLEYVISRATWVVVGMTILTIWWVGTHNCYRTPVGVGMLCSTHDFDWTEVDKWLRGLK